MPALTYTSGQFLPFTKIVSADMNQYFTDIKTLLNTTGLTSTNVQLNGLTRDRLATGSANQVVINDSSGNLTSEATLALSRGGLAFAPTLAGNSGLAIVVNAGETSFAIGAPSQASLTQAFSSDVTTLTAGEALTANDAVCLALSRDASNNIVYRVFRCNSTLNDRRINFIGFATAAVSVTAGVYTWVASANFVASNVITYSINGRSYTTNFTTDNATTLAAVATQMATDPEVSGAVSNGTNTVTVTGKGGLFINVTGSVVTGGVSQPTITYTNTVTAVGGSTRIRSFGDLTGMSGLTTGNRYYLDSSTGGITSTPSDTNPVFVGQALSSTVLFVNSTVGNFQFSTPTVFVKSHGSSDNTEANAKADVEHFNFTAWSAGTSDSVSRCAGQFGNCVLGTNHVYVDGANTAGTKTLTNNAYNKTSWTVNTNRATARSSGAVTVLSNKLLVGKGSTGTVSTALDIWSGSAWQNGAGSFAGAGCVNLAAFTYGSLGRFLGGSSNNFHHTWDGNSVGTDTVVPVSKSWGSGSSSGNTGTNGIISGDESSGTASYQWAGSWSASLTVTYASNNRASAAETPGNGASGFSTASGLAIVNGGAAGVTTSAYFNGSAWSAGTSSSSSRTGISGGCV